MYRTIQLTTIIIKSFFYLHFVLFTLELVVLALVSLYNSFNLFSNSIYFSRFLFFYLCLHQYINTLIVISEFNTKFVYNFKLFIRLLSCRILKNFIVILKFANEKRFLIF